MNIETLKGQLAQFGIKIDFLTKGLYAKLAALVPDNEKIIFAFEGIDGGSVPVIITSKSVYMIARGKGTFVGVNTAVIPLSKISSVTQKGSAFFGVFKTVSISEGAITHIIDKVPGPAAEKAIAAINQAQAQAAAPASVAAPLSQADELAKFKKLLDDGVLTQEEFDKKKAQILGL